MASVKASQLSAEPYANYMRKRTDKRRRKQVAYISKQLRQLMNVQAEFKKRRSAAIADAEVPSLAVQEYVQHEAFVESIVAVELLRVLRRLES